MSSDEQPFADLEATLKKTAAALRRAGVPFLLGGSLASWARGGPESRHDLDFMIKRDDVPAAVAALREVGMRADDPPEEWLVKVWDGDVLVDLIFYPSGFPIDDDVIARGEEMSVLSMEMRVMAIEDVLITKLMAIDEHHIRFEGLLPIARALRERIDWGRVRKVTAGSPFARAFFVLLEGLGIIGHAEPEAARRARVRVVTGPGSSPVEAG